MRVIALDADKALHDIIKIFHYGYIDEYSVNQVHNIFHSAIHSDIGYYLNVKEEFMAPWMAQVIRECLTNYIDTVLKALVHKELHIIFEALNSRFCLSDYVTLKVNDSSTLIPMLNSVRPDLAFLMDTDYVMLKSIAVVLDRVNTQNKKQLELKTMEFIATVQPQLSYEQINHVVRTDLLNARTVAMMVN